VTFVQAVEIIVSAAGSLFLIPLTVVAPDAKPLIAPSFVPKTSLDRGVRLMSKAFFFVEELRVSIGRHARASARR
jgi:hypothetical protein